MGTTDRPNSYPVSHVTDLEYTYGIPAAWGLRAARESAGRRWAHALRQSAAERQASFSDFIESCADDPDGQDYARELMDLYAPGALRLARRRVLDGALHFTELSDPLYPAVGRATRPAQPEQAIPELELRAMDGDR